MARIQAVSCSTLTILLLATAQGIPEKCGPGYHKDPDHGDCRICVYCTPNYHQSEHYFISDCYESGKNEAVKRNGYTFKPWCRAGAPNSFREVCKFPADIRESIHCFDGPLPGHRCNLTCPGDEVVSFECQPDATESIPHLCQSTEASSTPVPASTRTPHNPGTTQLPPGPQQEYLIPVIICGVLSLVVIVLIIILCPSFKRMKARKGSREELKVNVESGTQSNPSNSEPSVSDSLLEGGKVDAGVQVEEDEEDAKLVTVCSQGKETGQNHEVSPPPSYHTQGHKDMCLSNSEVSSQPESLPPPYSPREPMPDVGACPDTDNIWTRVDDSMTELKVPLDPSNPMPGDGNTLSKRLEVASGLTKGPGNNARRISDSGSLSLSPFPVVEFAASEPEPDRNPDDCSHLVNSLFTERRLREVLSRLLLQLEPLSSREPSLTMMGLATECLKWSHERAQHVRWARQENLQESPAHVVLEHMSQEGLKLGHIALYFSHPSHRNRKIVELLKTAETHENCPLCSRL